MLSLPIILQLSGLLLDITGAIFIFLNSPKIEFNTYLFQEDELIELNKKAAKKHLYTKIGLLLLIIGFLAQGIGISFSLF